MNAAKDPCFVKNLPTENRLLLDPECAVAELVNETLVYAGFDLDLPIYTKDGDRVRLIAIDSEHQFPIVGEVIDFGAEATWLARWSASGVYASSSADARRKHSLDPNCEPGSKLVEPGAALVNGAYDEMCAELVALHDGPLPFRWGRSLVEDMLASIPAGPQVVIRHYTRPVDSSPLTEGFARRPGTGPRLKAEDTIIAPGGPFKFVQRDAPGYIEEETFNALHPKKQEPDYVDRARANVLRAGTTPFYTCGDATKVVTESGGPEVPITAAPPPCQCFYCRQPREAGPPCRSRPRN